MVVLPRVNSALHARVQTHLALCVLRAGSHFDISISISINISITKICVNRDYLSISVRMAIAPAQFTSRESKIQ